MAAGELRGSRLPDAVMGEQGPGWEAWERWEQSEKGHRRTLAAAPGSFMRVKSGESELIYVVFPDGKEGCVGPTHHSWEWHEDGSVTVKPSIVCTLAEHGHDWHGFLQRGAWTGA